MSHFDEAFKVLLSPGHEGRKFTNIPEDRGGPTKFGMSWRTLRKIGDMRFDLNKNGEIDSEDIENLTEEHAHIFYKKYFWDEYRFERIKDKNAAIKLFDLTVWMGPSRSAKIFQKVIKFLEESSFGGVKNFKVDGIFGPQSRALLDKHANNPALLNLVRRGAVAFLYQLLRDDPEQQKFKDGWMRRAQF